MSEQKFEEALKRLEEIVEALERGDLALDASLRLFEEGICLSRWCTKKLNEAERRIEILTRDEEGEPILRPFDAEEEE